MHGRTLTGWGRLGEGRVTRRNYLDREQNTGLTGNIAAQLTWHISSTPLSPHRQAKAKIDAAGAEDGAGPISWADLIVLAAKVGG